MQNIRKIFKVLLEFQRIVNNRLNIERFTGNLPGMMAGTMQQRMAGNGNPEISQQMLQLNPPPPYLNLHPNHHQRQTDQQQDGFQFNLS